MATTRIMSIHINKGKTARQCITERLDYIMNPEKTDGGILISSYACEPQTAADEFMLYRQEYLANTGREIENEILGYHVRQAFKPGEITPEDANAIGKDWPKESQAAVMLSLWRPISTSITFTITLSFAPPIWMGSINTGM